MFEALDSNYHIKDNTQSSKFFPPPTLKIGLATEPGGLDPSTSMDATTFLVATQVYDTLTRYRPGDSVPIPALAQSWSVWGHVCDRSGDENGGVGESVTAERGWKSDTMSLLRPMEAAHAGAAFRARYAANVKKVDLTSPDSAC